MKRRSWTLLLMVSVSPCAMAQSVFSAPASARVLGMGGLGVASRDDDVLFYNPAQLVVARGMSVSGERESSRERSGALSSVTRFNGGGIAVGMTMNQFESANSLVCLLAGPGTCGLQPDSLPSSSFAAVAGFAQAYKGTRIGINAKYAEEEGSFRRVSKGLLDVGVARDFSRYFTFGAAVQNIASRDTSGLPSKPLRTTLGLAGAGPAGPFDVAATAGASIDPRRRVHAAGGAELSWSWLDGYSAAVRAGLRDPLATQRAFTAGAGYTVDRLTIDYALETLSGSRIGHRIGLRIR
jgi:hypothetical protein